MVDSGKFLCFDIEIRVVVTMGTVEQVSGKL